MTTLLTAALRVRDLQESVDRAEIHRDLPTYLASLEELGKARRVLERLKVEQQRELLAVKAKELS